MSQAPSSWRTRIVPGLEREEAQRREGGAVTTAFHAANAEAAGLELPRYLQLRAAELYLRTLEKEREAVFKKAARSADGRLGDARTLLQLRRAREAGLADEDFETLLLQYLTGTLGRRALLAQLSSTGGEQDALLSKMSESFSKELGATSVRWLTDNLPASLAPLDALALCFRRSGVSVIGVEIASGSLTPQKAKRLEKAAEHPFLDECWLVVLTGQESQTGRVPQGYGTMHWTGEECVTVQPPRRATGLTEDNALLKQLLLLARRN